VEPHILDFAQFEKWKGKKVLEIGCGMGTATVNFARAGAQVTAIDLSSESIKLAKDRMRVYGLEDKVTLYQGNAEDLSSVVPVEKYDLVYSFGVIHHTPNPGNVLQEIRKYCSAETEIRIMLYAKWSWKVLWIILRYGKGMFWNAEELIAEYSEAQTGSPVSYSYSFRDIRKLFQGFHIDKMYKDHIFPYVIEKYKRHEYQKVWYFRWMPQPIFRWLEQQLGWHLLIVAHIDHENPSYTTNGR
jgi:ubiquinone/menaquinone biosynthesis C-methylase UbiE